MTPEQQAAIDRGIIHGDLVDAIRLYRAATGSDLASASSYVQQRSASLNEPSSNAPFSAVAQPFPAAAPDQALAAAQIGQTIAKRVPLIVISVIVFAAIVGVIPLLSIFLVKDKLLAQFTIVQEPYYPQLVARIRDDARFRDALGVPIAIDDANVRCNLIRDNAVMQQANCTMPVSGPKGAGSLHVRVQNRPGALDSAMSLHVGDRTIDSNS